MARKKWRTVSCTDDSLRSHSSQLVAYTWIAGRMPGLRFRVQVDEGYGWENYATVVSTGGGTDEE
jgi:hypothetical protein